MVRKSTTGKTSAPALEEALKASLVNGRLPCAAAFALSKKLKVTPKEIGDTANKLKIKVATCQLGCFP